MQLGLFRRLARVHPMHRHTETADRRTDIQPWWAVPSRRSAVNQAPLQQQRTRHYEEVNRMDSTNCVNAVTRSRGTRFSAMCPTTWRLARPTCHRPVDWHRQPLNTSQPQPPKYRANSSTIICLYKPSLGPTRCEDVDTYLRKSTLCLYCMPSCR